MSDATALAQMIQDIEREYHLPPGAIFGRGRNALEVSARFRFYCDAVKAGFSQAFIARFIGRDISTVASAVRRMRREGEAQGSAQVITDAAAARQLIARHRDDAQDAINARDNDRFLALQTIGVRHWLELVAQEDTARPRGKAESGA